MSLRLKKQGEKALERALAAGATDDEQPGHVKGKWKGHPDAETIEESEEPPPSAGLEHSSTIRSHSHRRELADGGSDHR
jgi:PH and SEC7 domain-containing protein